MKQLKILLRTSIAIMLFISVGYSDSNMIILESKKSSDVVNVLIKGNGEECIVSMDNTGVLIDTKCLQLTNSKKIKILCTKTKKICKTVSEVRNTLELKPLSRTGMSSPSFDCTKASTQTEHDICRSDRVSALDLKLGNIYLTIKSEIPNERFQNLIQIQREWVKEREELCGTQSDFSERERCLVKTYKDRIDAFGMISVMNSKIDYSSILFTEVYENGTSKERFELAAYLYYEKKNIKQSSKLLRKIIADEQEDFVSAFFALGDIHKEYVKRFPQVSQKLLDENHGSIGMSLIELNATQDEVINVLIEESYLLNSAAEIMLMVKYQYSNEHPAYDKRILHFYKECAEEGIPRCEQLLGDVYLNGWGIKQDIEEGIQLLEQSGLEDAYISLADYYYLQKDIEKSKTYYKKASILGSSKATYNLGVFAQEEKKYEEAFKYFESSLEKDDSNYPAMLELSRMYIQDWGIELNYEKAIDLLQIVIDNSGEAAIKKIAIINLSIAEYGLGMKYLTGRDSNKTKAFILLEKSAIKNHMYAQYELAKMYFHGDGVKKDEKKVIKWYKNAAEQGHPEAQLYLSLRYLKGRGVEADHEKALYWAKKSAENDNLNGQYVYGSLMLKKNRDEAIDWLKKAASQGHKKAKEKLQELSAAYKTEKDAKTQKSKVAKANKKASTKIEWETKLLGKHALALQWISWKRFGQVIIKKEGNKITIQGGQYGGDEEDGKNDYLKIKGTIIYVDKDSFIFDGDILTKVYHINNGEECKRSGKKFFQIRGKRKYWRMQNKSNDCGNSFVIDYVDIFFEEDLNLKNQSMKER